MEPGGAPPHAGLTADCQQSRGHATALAGLRTLLTVRLHLS